ncbi:hypothetical protein GCM10025869_08000 [Homoserinibacter gongjuensis]|uniref:MFS transporter n=1 Tax=Homoserinibacter gongjuensis TaxID=1162968 RepID=A0ABQ6JS12_9MICO|nr:MFS transporter [Homoserinibacter gongjuensis]GMA90271.1 hypothetical protein GCM10025869_08000 [Homoserinibacter gongjuensis]
MTEAAIPVTRLAQLRRMTSTWFFVVAFIARIPVAMDVVGVLTLVSVERGLATAGLVSAALGIASGFGGPVIGAITDRVGQRPVLLIVAVLHTGLLLGLLAVVYGGAPLGVLLVLAILAGATIPPASPLARARWLALLSADTRAGGRGVPVALGYETMADEISFVGGPILVGVLATAFGPAAPLLVAAALTLVFVAAFGLHPTAVAVPPGSHDGAQRIAPVANCCDRASCSPREACSPSAASSAPRSPPRPPSWRRSTRARRRACSTGSWARPRRSPRSRSVDCRSASRWRHAGSCSRAPWPPSRS